MSAIPEEVIRRAQERAEGRSKEWLERKADEMQQQMQFAKQIWGLIAPANQELTEEKYQEQVKKLLEGHLQALADTR